MRHFLILLLFLIVSHGSFAQAGDYFVFPQNLSDQLYRSCKPIADWSLLEKKIVELDLSEETELGEYNASKFVKIDLNADGQCEILHYFTSALRGWPYDFVTIYQVSADNRLEKIGDFISFMLSFSVPDGEGKYLQIIEGYTAGVKSDPFFYARLYRFDGKSYSAVAHPQKTKSEYREEGLKAYRAKDYQLAYKAFWNAFKTPHRSAEDELHDANNVALALIKLKRFEQANSLLLPMVVNKENGAKERAAAYFNLGLMEEARANLPLALEHYQNSCKLKETKACGEKAEKIKEVLAIKRNN